MSNNALTISETEKKIAERIDPQAMGGLTVSAQAGGVIFANADEVMNFAKMMAVSAAGVRKHLRGNPGACLAIVTQAVEWGMSAYAVANKSYFVNDQIAFESQLVQAVILKRAPIKGRIKFEFTGEGDKRVCRAWCRLADDPEEIVEYVSPAFGRITPKNSPLWKSDPDQQHAYYSGRALCRRHFPDVLLGVYTDDELPPAHQGADRARDVTPKGLGAKLDALAARPSTVEPGSGPAADESFGDLDAPDIDAADGGQQPGGDDESRRDEAPEINRDHDDFKLGWEGGFAGLRKGFNSAIKADPVRLAHYEAGFAAGQAHDPDMED
ncbi:recombinase RecT [Methylorubrum extorquens]|uniref:recombinase RecT n=1 Tax=Methylorubrum extorquens TaxID=408 RepID=UPI0022373B6F|nr:recombinase RecT [Methylorubrum extorquens]UYW25728.1 recombinase RecT [Methylorubrum extorquens]